MYTQGNKSKPVNIVLLPPSYGTERKGQRPNWNFKEIWWSHLPGTLIVWSLSSDGKIRYNSLIHVAHHILIGISLYTPNLYRLDMPWCWSKFLSLSSIGACPLWVCSSSTCNHHQRENSTSIKVWVLSQNKPVTLFFVGAEKRSADTPPRLQRATQKWVFYPYYFFLVGNCWRTFVWKNMIPSALTSHLTHDENDNGWFLTQHFVIDIILHSCFRENLSL